MPQILIKEPLWSDFAALHDIDPQHTRLVSDQISAVLNKFVGASQEKLKNGHVEVSKIQEHTHRVANQVRTVINEALRPAANNFFGNDQTPHFTDTSNKYGQWPLTPDVTAFAVYINISPLENLKADHTRDSDPEYKHVEEKKFWIRCGYRFQGMDDPESAAEHVAGDINGDRPLSDLPEKAKAAHSAMRSKFKNWWKQNHKK